jgi:dTDP-4-dehydrorhamnose 3,5-epimerase
MKLERLAISGLLLIEPRKFSDHRGFLSETYNKKALSEVGFDKEFVQDNHSFSAACGVVRGLHYQSPPFAQDKLVRVLKGRILDVALDIRKSSPTYGQHVMVELSAVNWKQLLVPAGFAHGFVTLEENTEVAYKVTNYYSPPHDCGVLWCDPALAINWPVSPSEATVSVKDSTFPPLAEVTTLFD